MSALDERPPKMAIDQELHIAAKLWPVSTLDALTLGRLRRYYITCGSSALKFKKSQPLLQLIHSLYIYLLKPGRKES
jgi:hypothetical protein